MVFPKIIHTIAPSDKLKWHSKWNECYQSWFKHFDSAEFKFIMWSDEEVIDNFVKVYYNEFYDSYVSLPHKIMKIDIARLLILHKFGGIYHDMDYFCYKNFYDYVVTLARSFTHKKYNFFVVGSSNSFYNEILSNSLVVSIKNNPVFYFIVQMAFSIIETFKKSIFFDILLKNPDPSIIALTGPNMVLSSMLMTIDLNENDSLDYYILNESLFNPKKTTHGEPIFTEHFSTSVWINNKNIQDNKFVG